MQRGPATSGEQTSQTPDISVFSTISSTTPTESPQSESTVSDLIRKKYGSGKLRKKPTLKDLQILLENAAEEEKAVEELEQGLFRYAKGNLNQVGSGNNYTVETLAANSEKVIKKSHTKPERATAISLLLDVIKTSSASKIYSYVKTPNFQEMMGAQEWKFNISREHLSSIVGKFIKRYERFQELNQNDSLLEILLDPTISAATNNSDLGVLFWRYNPKLVADVIVNVYKDKAFIFSFGRTNIDYNFLSLLLEDNVGAIEFCNKARSQFKAQLLLPERAKAPGKNQLEDEKLDSFQLYQYEDDTLVAIEQWITQEYRSLLINNINGIAAKPLKHHSAFHFYFISAARYRVLDPDDVKNADYKRFSDFRADLRSLFNSYSPKNFAKPVIFCGIINIDGTHYVPYFIHKNPGTGKAEVITVDPSAQMYPNVDKDTKSKTQAKFRKIFSYIFPGCIYHDAEVNQMLRERDCGPNSATTIIDAFEKPLLYLVGGQLYINRHLLSIHADNIGIDYYSGTFVYPEELEKASLLNRQVWADRLSTFTKIRYLTARAALPGEDKNDVEKRPYRIGDEFIVKDQYQLDYNYVAAVTSQKRQDLASDNISSVQSLLYSHEDGRRLKEKIITEYKETMVPPSPRELVEFIKARVTHAESFKSLISGHGNNIETLANEVIMVLVREQIPAALEHFFNVEVIATLPNTFNLDGERMVKEFLQNEFCFKVYKSLPIYQQSQVENKLNQLAEIAIRQKRIELYEVIIDRELSQHCRTLLNYVPRVAIAPALIATGPSDPAIISIITQKLTNPETWSREIKAYDIKIIREGLSHLSTYAPEKLHGIIHKHVRTTLSDIVETTVEKIRLDFSEKIRLKLLKLDDLLSLCNPQNCQFIPWTNHQLAQCLAGIQSQSAILSPIEANSCLGDIILAKVNPIIYKEVQAAIGGLIEEGVKKLLEAKNVQKVLTDGKTLQQLTSMLTPDDQIAPGVLSEEYLSQLMDIRNLDAISSSAYSHPIVRNFATAHLRSGIAMIIKTTINSEFEKIAAKILECSRDILQLKSILNYFSNFNDSEQVMKILCSRYMEVDLNFFASNFFEPRTHASQPYSLNPCGARFHTWFINTILNSMQRNYQKSFGAINNCYNSIIIIKNIGSVITNRQNKWYTQNYFSQVMEELTSILQELQNLIERFNSNSLTLNNFDYVYELNHKNFQRCIAQTITTIYQNCFRIGDVLPGSISSQLRPYLYQLLSADNVLVLMPKDATTADKALVKNLTEEYFRYLVIPTQSRMVSLDPVHALPLTYGKPITKQLLLDCISYWFTSRSFFYEFTHPSLWFSASGLPRFIADLISLVNQLVDVPAEVVDLHAAELVPQLNFDDELEIYESSDLVDKIKACLKSTTTLTNATATELKFSELVKFLSLKSAMKNLTKDESIHISERQVDEILIRQIRAIKSKDPNARINDRELKQDIRNQLINFEINVRERIKAIKKQYPSSSVDEAAIRRQAEFESTAVDEKWRQLSEELAKEKAEFLRDNPRKEFTKRVTRQDAMEAHYQDNVKRLVKEKVIAKLKSDNPSGVITEDMLIRFPAIQRLKFTQEAKEALKGTIGSPDTMAAADTFIDAEFSSRGEELKQRRPKKHWLMFFNSETHLERLILLLKKKHGNVDDFVLDEDDIKNLRASLEKRWLELVHELGASAAQKRYLYYPDGDDKLYIAVAEVLTKFYRKKGMKTTAPEILIPGFCEGLKFYNAAGNLPPSMCWIYGLVNEGDDVNSGLHNIPLSNLIITGTGFALDIECINDRYIKEQKLINPYTNTEFTLDELDDICQHPKASVLLEKVQRNYGYLSGISERGIAILVQYLNSAIFTNGFSGMYNESQKKKVEDALEVVKREVAKMPAEEQKAFREEKIPNLRITVDDVFNISTRECLVTSSVSFAKLVIAYRGARHGLSNSTLVQRAHESGPIPSRSHEFDFNIIKNNAEKHLMEYVLGRRGVGHGARKNRFG